MHTGANNLFARLVSAACLLLAALVLLSCSLVGGREEVTPIWEYHLIDERTIEVMSTTGGGWKTWVASVEESPTSVVIEVRTRATQDGAGVGGGEGIWLTIHLAAPLATRAVIDRASNAEVPRSTDKP